LLNVKKFILGPVATNSYLIADSETKEAAVIDPAWDGHIILEEAKIHNYSINQIWLTHAHFDHIGGVGAIINGIKPSPSIALHPKDFPLWQEQGGAPLFGYRIDTDYQPAISLKHGMILQLGSIDFEVRHTPGHTPGHVIFYCREEGILFCGDVIFWRSIGRTDLPGGSYNTLINSIHNQILVMPENTRLFTGHMEETSVGEEKHENPFLK
jgi:glyoxylase-like metal-dependent hydrolase (beta-lactamase superfamily II)